MADPVVELEPVTTAVEPGGQTRVVVTVVNEGNIVEGYRVEVLDELDTPGRGGREVAGPASWFEVLPVDGAGSGEGAAAGSRVPDLTVYPGQQGTVVVVFSPPVGVRAPGGSCAFAVRVTSVVDADASTVVEGMLEIGKVSALQAKIVPVTSTGRWRGKHLIELSNWGNTPAELRVVAEDPDRALGFLVRPETVTLPVGASAQVRLKARTRKPVLRGQAPRLPFTVRAEPASGVPADGALGRPGMLGSGMPLPGALPDPHTAVVDGAFNQKPILTAGVMLGAGLVLVGAVGLTAYGLMQRGEPAPTFAELGVPDTPQVSVEATGPEAVRVSWIPIDKVEGYKLFQLDSQGAATSETELAPELGATPIEGLDPQQEYCFTMAAVRGEVQSPQSPPACVTTLAAPAPEATDGPGATDAEATDPAATDPSETGGQTAGGEPGGQAPGQTGEATGAATETGAETDTGEPTGQESTGSPSGPTTAPPVVPAFAPGEWAAVLGVFPSVGPGEFGADQLVTSLDEAGVGALAVSSDQFPNLGLAQPGWLVLVGGYDSYEAAFAGCQEVQADQPALVTFCNPPVQPVAAAPVG